jgi:NitT/TauT family transport system substrate-binding protein
MKQVLLHMLAVLLAGGMALLPGCGKAPDTPAQAGKGPVPAKAAPAELRLGYFANLTHAQAVLGVASGDFQNAIGSTALKTKVFNAGPSLVEAMLAGELDLGYVGPGPAVAAYLASNGKGIRVISGSAANGVVIVARADAPIQKLEDLAGKMIATPQLANTQDIAARHYLKLILKEDLRSIRPIANAEQGTMMQRGEIDAAWVPEPWGAKLTLENKARMIAEEKDLWPGGQFATTIVVARPEFLKEYPDTVRAFLQEHRKWTRKLQDDAQGQLAELSAGLFALTNKKLPEGVLPQAIIRVKFTDDPLPESIQTMAQWAYDLGFAKQTPKLESLVEPAFAGAQGAFPAGVGGAK